MPTLSKFLRSKDSTKLIVMVSLWDKQRLKASPKSGTVLTFSRLEEAREAAKKFGFTGIKLVT